MFNVINILTITQRTNNRSKVLRMDFLQSYNWESTWDQLTDNGSITIPKNLKVRDDKNPLEGSNVNVGGFSSGTPLFMRGDRVQLEVGYNYFKPDLNRRVNDTAVIVKGYISKVHSGIPVTFDVEDNMWLLKQTPLTNRTFADSDTLETILQWVIDAVNNAHKTALTFRALTDTGFGELDVQNETAAQLLNRLQRDYGFRFYFRGDELRGGIVIYFPDDVKEHIFIMNGHRGNVLADGQDLEFQRKDDIVLSAIAHNTITEKTGSQTKDGQDKTKKTRLEVLVTIRNNQVETKVIAKGERAPENTEGERRTLFFPNATTTKELAELAEAELRRYYYDGLKGSFVVFGIPHVKHGDNVRIVNPKQPEQEGLYRVRKVTSTGGDGLRQTIELHFKINA